MASSGSIEQHMGPYYSPDESQDITDMFDNSRGRSANPMAASSKMSRGNQNLGLLPDLN